MKEVINKILNENPKPISTAYSQFLQNLVRSLMQKNQNKRPSIENILNYPEINKYVFFLNISFSSILKK